MDQVRALNALEPFLALAKSANSPRAASDLVSRATSQPTTYVFTELLLTPQIQALSQSPEYIQYLTLLQIFSYGTYTDYTNYTLPPALPALNEAQTLKLRQLTLLALARSPANLTYKNLLKLLELSSSRALEDLVISCIYAGLIEAKLDPHNQMVAISSVAPLRDLSPQSVPGMIATLQAWNDRCTTTLKSLEQHIASIKNAAIARKREEVEWQRKLEMMIEEESKDGGNKSQTAPQSERRSTRNMGGGVSTMLGAGLFGGGGGSGTGGNAKRGMGMGIDDDVEMDIDELQEPEGRVGKQKKRHGL